MRVLVVEPGPHFSVADVCRGVAKGLQANGCDVAVWNYGDRLDFYTGAHLKKGRRWVQAFDYESAVTMAANGLSQALYTWWPDVVVIVSGFFIPPTLWAVLHRRPHHTVLWLTESPYEDDKQAMPARYTDTVILNDPLNLEQFRAVNRRTWYVPHSYDPDTHKPGPGLPDLAADFGFVGTGFPSRVEFFEQVDWSGITARLGGNWLGLAEGSPLEPFLLHGRGECMDNVDAVTLYQSVTVGANLYRKETTDGGTSAGLAMGPREVEMAASGLFFLREPRPEGDDVLKMLPTFTEPGEFGELLRWWVRHSQAREDAAAAAMLAVSDRTFTAATRFVLNLVDKDTVTRRMVGTSQGA